MDLNYRPLLLMVFLLAATLATAQRSVRYDEALQLAEAQNARLISARLETERSGLRRKTAFELNKTQLSVMQGQYNSNSREDQNISISQGMTFPTAFVSISNWYEQMRRNSVNEEKLIRLEVTTSVKLNLQEQLVQRARLDLLKKLSGLFDSLSRAADIRFRAGEGTQLEQQQAALQQMELRQQMERAQQDQQMLQWQLGALLGFEEQLAVADSSWNRLALKVDTASILELENPHLKKGMLQVAMAQEEIKVERNKFLPDLQIGYFNQTLIGAPIGNGELAGRGQRFQGWQAGIAIPLWFRPTAIKLQMARLQKQSKEIDRQQAKRQWQADWAVAKTEFLKQQNLLDFYEKSALPLALQIRSKAELSYRKGELDFLGASMAFRQAIQTEEQYLLSIWYYHQSLIKLEFLSGMNITNEP
jgi:heavy metal efflux system protein